MRDYQLGLFFTRYSCGKFWVPVAFQVVRCQFFGLYLRWTLCGVSICGSALYFVRTISAFVSRTRLSSWSGCALEGMGNVVLVFLLWVCCFPTLCVYNGTGTYLFL